MTDTTTWICTLSLTGRPRAVDGQPYDGEVMRYLLLAVPAAQRGTAGEADATREIVVELRLGRALLQSGRWPRLRLDELARHGQAHLRELLQHRGLPAASHVVHLLDVHTDQGAYRDGSPFKIDAHDEGAFEVLAPAPPDEQAAARR